MQYQVGKQKEPAELASSLSVYFVQFVIENIMG